MPLIHRPFHRVAIVNRGEAAVRFIRAARSWSTRRKEALEVVALFTTPDREALFVREADAAIDLGDALVPGSDGKLRSAYLDVDRVVRLVVDAGCDAVWPGWGFVSERPDFADACAERGLVFIGPSGESMRLLGDKIGGKRVAEEHGVPVTDWSRGPVADAHEAARHARRIGFPVLLKAAAGGGGRGIRLVRDESEIDAAFLSASNEARAAFGDATLLVEGFAPEARHVEVQVLADSQGHVHALGTRDCSMQRRHQKVLEEAPAPNLGALAVKLEEAAIAIARASGYVNAGTAEFLVLPDLSAFYFLEMNTRLQVEHPVTECVTGLDLVALQIDVARGEALPDSMPPARGHAIEARLNAEDADDGFRPSAGRLLAFELPHGPGLRIDSGFAEGDVVPSEFDSMLAKVVATGSTREEARARLDEALSRSTVAIEGGASNRSLLLELVGNDTFAAAPVTTRWLDRHLGERPAPLERAYLDAALVAAAVGEHLRARHDEVTEFFKQAQRGLPQSAPASEPRTFRFGVAQTPVSVDVLAIGPERYRVACGGSFVDVGHRPTGPATALLSLRGRRVPVVQVVTPSALHVEVDGVAHRLSRASDGRVVAPVPAAVTEVCVKEGDTVRAGERLFTLEVMKMEVAVHAPLAGRIGRLFIDGASRVSAGQALALIEATSSESEAPKPSTLHPFSTDGRADDPALVPGLLKGAMLGYDFAPNMVDDALLRLRTGDATLSLPQLSRLLDAYVAHERLFDPRPGQDGVASVDQLARHLRQPRAGGEGLPASFTKALRDALAWHDVRTLDASPTHECALVRIVQAHRAIDLRDQLLSTALAVIVRGDHPERSEAELTALRDRLEMFAALVIRRDRALAESAYTALYLLCDRPRQLAEARALGQRASQLFSGADSDDARGALEELPNGALLSLVAEVLPRDATTRARLLDLLVQRLHPEAERASVVDEANSAAHYWTRAGRVLALLSSPDQVTTEVRRALTAADASTPLQVDVFLPEPTAAELTSFETASTFDLPSPSLRRLSLNWGSAELGRLSRTFERHADGTFAENRAHRDLHPARIEAAEIARLGEFELTRLPAPGEVYLALARAREDATDERLVCVVEVERIDPVRDAAGKLLRVPGFERVFMTALHAMREAHVLHPVARRPFWNRLVLFVRPMLTMPTEEIEAIAQRLTPATFGVGLEKFVLRARVPSKSSPAGRAIQIEWTNPTGHGPMLTFSEPAASPVHALTADERRVVEARRRGLFYPYELIRSLASEHGTGPYPPGRFVELDLAADGTSLVEVSRPHGQNTAQLVVGRVTNFFPPFDDGLSRVLVVGDPTRGMGSLAEPECRRLLAAIDLAHREGLAVEWVPVSSGARIAMDSGTENLDWTARVLARIVRFTQGGGVINIVLDGISVGAQSYWNAEATMLMHCKGTLVMTPQGSMLLTGKKALEFAGSVAAEDNNGIGGFERIMGPNGEAQYFAPDLASAYALLFRHLALTAIAPGETRPRRQPTADVASRDAMLSPYAPETDGFRTIGELFDERTNAGRKKPFSIREVMRAVVDQDVEPLERWASWQGAESAVVWEASLGGDPVACIGIESRPVPRRGESPSDGPDAWTSGTLFPLSSKKVARALNAASGVRPVVVLANLSGFDGSPDSLRHLQLEYGAEIGRAVVNFKGPLVFCVVARYHGGAYVVFSRALNPSLEALALKGSYASVIGGGPAAAVVFPGVVRKRAQAEPAVVAARRALEQASLAERATLAATYEKLLAEAIARTQSVVAREFDGVHTVDRALQVGSLDAVIDPAALRAELIARVRAEEKMTSDFGVSLPRQAQANA